MTAKELESLLDSLGACRDARKWAAGKTLDEVWTTCEIVSEFCITKREPK